MSRPTDYNLVIADEICEWIAGGGSVRSYCAQEDAPAISTVMRWKHEHPEFSEQYAHAKEMCAETYADEIVEIADKAHDRDTAAAANVQIQARKWASSKLAPKTYGDKIGVEHSGRIDGDLLGLQSMATDELRETLLRTRDS